MKILISILLMSTVLCNELSFVIDVFSTEVFHMDSSFEVELEKDTKENVEDSTKVKIRQNINFTSALSGKNGNDLISHRLISTPYLEIQSPPPEHF